MVEVEIQSISAQDTVNIREKVLWPGKPEMCVLPEDNDPNATHFGLVIDQEIVGVVTVFTPNQGGKGRA